MYNNSSKVSPFSNSWNNYIKSGKKFLIILLENIVTFLRETFSKCTWRIYWIFYILNTFIVFVTNFVLRFINILPNSKNNVISLLFYFFIYINVISSNLYKFFEDEMYLRIWNFLMIFLIWSDREFTFT